MSTSYVGCDGTTLAVVLFSLALGMLALNTSSFEINHLDIAPRYAGVLMGITNTAATIPGMVGPYVAGYLTNNEVSYFDFNFFVRFSQMNAYFYSLTLETLRVTFNFLF